MAVGLSLVALFLLAFSSGSDTIHLHPWDHVADIQISVAPTNDLKEVIKLLDHRSHVLHQSNLRDEKKISVKQDRSLTMYINSLKGIPKNILSHLPWHFFHVPAKEKDDQLLPMLPDSKLEYVKEGDEDTGATIAESTDEDSSGKELDSSQNSGQPEYSEKLLDHVLEELREHRGESIAESSDEDSSGKGESIAESSDEASSEKEKVG